MSKKSYIKQAFIAKLFDHPEAEKYYKKAFENTDLDQLQSEFAQMNKLIKKDDFFMQTEDGKYLIDCESAWKNFDKASKIAADNGETFTVDDFLQIIDSRDERTILQSAEEHGGLEKIFTADNWVKRFDDLEQLWFKTSYAQRQEMNDGQGLLPIKREIFKREGKELREDALIKAGIENPYQTVPEVFTKRGNFEHFQEKLKAANLKFTKADVFLPDAEGDPMFWAADFWKKFEIVVQLLSQNKEGIGSDDFLFKRGYKKNMLERAAEHKALNKIFKPSVWEGRVNEMVELWSHVKPAWVEQLKGQPIYECIAEAEDATYGNVVTFDERSTKADLISPLNTDKTGKVWVTPLSLKSTWEKYDEIERILMDKKDPVSLKDLRQKNGQHGASGLQAAAMAGEFDKVVALAKQNDEKIELSDLADENKLGVSVLQILIDRKELDQLFVPEVWIGRVPEMETLWGTLPYDARKQVKYDKILSKVNHASVQEKGGGITLKKRRGPKGPTQ